MRSQGRQVLQVLAGSLEATLMSHPWSKDYPFLMIEDIRKFLHRARDYVDSLDHSLERFDNAPRLLDNRQENGVRQCIDRALRLLQITEDELEGFDDA